MIRNTTPAEQRSFLLALILSLVGDIFFFGSLLFKNFMINFFIALSPNLTLSALDSTGQEIALFYLATLGSLMYLIAFLVWAVGKEELNERVNLALAGLGVWFVTDAIVSFVYGFAWNIASNFGFLLIGIVFLMTIKFNQTS